MIRFSESLALKLVSILLALILWVTILGLKREEVKKVVKLEPLLAPGTVITNRIPEKIEFTLSGPRVLLKDVERRIQPIRPDLKRHGETAIPIEPRADLLGELPPGVRVTAIQPPQFVIRIERIIERYVQVSPSLIGTPAEGFEVSQTKAIPNKVALTGPRSIVESIEFVGTEPFDIRELKGTKEGVINLEVDSSLGIQLSRERTVRVMVTTRRVRGGGQ